MAKIVIALGGNALGNTPEEQMRLVRSAAKAIADLTEQGHDILIVHGNGPQVGMINTGLSCAAEQGAIAASVPFPECGAMSQGYIGYHIQNSIRNELARRGAERSVCSIVTQVLVDAADPAFAAPTKPIGAFFPADQAARLTRERGWVMAEDAGRGYRRMVPSPKPLDVIEKQAIRALLAAGQIVVAAGGGGIPVLYRDGALCGVPAVIDKDLAAEKLAELIEADMLVILTAVERVALDFGKPTQRYINAMDTDQVQQYIGQGQFAPGSMLPKVQAALAFALLGGQAVIASLDNAALAVRGESGTLIRSRNGS